MDREKVINGLKQMLSDYAVMEKISVNQKCFTLLYHKAMTEDALALLKEQPKIVRCKDCKHGEQCNQNLGEFYLCGKDIGTFETSVHSADWFCADGERKDG